MEKITRKNFLAALGLGVAAVPAALYLGGCGSDNASSSSGTAASSTGASAASEGSATADAASPAIVDTSKFTLVEAGKLTVGCSADYPPMEYQDGDKIVGFDWGVMDEICSRIGLECNFLPTQSFDTLITQVVAGTKMDVAISSITINDTRLEEVNFTDPYYDSNLAIVVLDSSSATERADLADAVFGGQSGSTGEEWVKENYKNNDYTPFDTMVECLSSLRTGKIQAAVFDEPVASNMVATEYTDCRVLDVIATGEQYGIAVNKNNGALLAAMNAALEEMDADGTMDKLRETWITGSGAASTSAASSAASDGKDGPADSKDASAAKN